MAILIEFIFRIESLPPHLSSYQGGTDSPAALFVAVARFGTLTLLLRALVLHLFALAMAHNRVMDRGTKCNGRPHSSNTGG